jgi:hypothetical protein
MPVRIESGVNYRRLGQLADEFTQHWKRLQAFYLDAVVGFDLVRGHVVAEQEQARSFVRGSDLDSEAFQDTRMFTYTQILSEDFCTSGIHRATQGEVKARNKIDGENFTTLGQLCTVSFCAFWNDYLRREYVLAKGKLAPEERDGRVVKESLRLHASNDLWGDLNYLRNSIVHNHSIATSDVGRSKLIKWFKPGDSITITPERMRAIFLALLTYRNELDKEQYPAHYIQL